MMRFNLTLKGNHHWKENLAIHDGLYFMWRQNVWYVSQSKSLVILTLCLFVHSEDKAKVVDDFVNNYMKQQF